MKTIKVQMTDAMHASLLVASRKDANNIGASKGAAYAVRKCCRQHLPRLGIKVSVLDMDDQQYAEYLTWEAEQ